MESSIYANQRVGIFVDVQNLFYSAKHTLGGRINYEKLLTFITGGRRLIRATAYVLKDADVDMSPFLNVLHNCGYEVKIKTIRKRSNGTSKGGWSLGMALDTTAMADRLDVVALTTGDGEFTPLVQHLAMQGLQVEIYALESSTANELKEAASRYIPIDEDLLYRDNRERDQPDGQEERSTN